MIGFFKRIARGNEGQALPMALVLLLVGALLVPTSVAYMDTSLKAKIAAEDKLKELYAADAAVEYVLWCLKEGEEVPGCLPAPVNNKSVTLLPVESVPSEKVHSVAGDYRDLCNGNEGNLSSGALEIGSAIEGPYGLDYYYTITVTNNSEEPMPLANLSCLIPHHFEYGGIMGSDITLNPPEKVWVWDGPWGWGTWKLVWNFGGFPVTIPPNETRFLKFRMVYWAWSWHPPPRPYTGPWGPSPDQLSYYIVGQGETGGNILEITAVVGNTTLKVCAVNWLEEGEVEGWQEFFPDLSQFSILSWEYK